MSPDKRFDAQLVSMLYPTTFDRHPTQPSDCLAIIDTEKRKTDFVPLLTPLHALRWTGDSKTIITIEHIAGGSQASLLHYDNGQWQRQEIVPPEFSTGHYSVTDLKTDTNGVTITYKVSSDSEGGSTRHYYVYTFKVDAATGKLIKMLSKHEIDADKYMNLPIPTQSSL